MIKKYEADIISDADLKSVVDYEINEVKLHSVIASVENDILALRLRKMMLMKMEGQRVVQITWKMKLRAYVSKIFKFIFGGK